MDPMQLLGWLQQPHKHSYTLEVAIYTQLALRSFDLFYTKALKWHLKGPLATPK